MAGGVQTRLRAANNANLPPGSPTVKGLRNEKVVRKRIHQWETLEFSPSKATPSKSVDSTKLQHSINQPDFGTVTRRSPRIAKKSMSSHAPTITAESDDENIFDQNHNSKRRTSSPRSVKMVKPASPKKLENYEQQPTVSFDQSAKSPSNLFRLPRTPRYGPSKLSQEITLSESECEMASLSQSQVDDTFLSQLSSHDNPHSLTMEVESLSPVPVDESLTVETPITEGIEYLETDRHGYPESPYFEGDRSDILEMSLEQPSDEEYLAEPEDDVIRAAVRESKLFASASCKLGQWNKKEKPMPLMLGQFFMFIFTVATAITLFQFGFENLSIYWKRFDPNGIDWTAISKAVMEKVGNMHLEYEVWAKTMAEASMSEVKGWFEKKLV